MPDPPPCCSSNFIPLLLLRSQDCSSIQNKFWLRHQESLLCHILGMVILYRYFPTSVPPNVAEVLQFQAPTNEVLSCTTNTWLSSHCALVLRSRNFGNLVCQIKSYDRYRYQGMGSQPGYLPYSNMAKD